MLDTTSDFGKLVLWVFRCSEEPINQEEYLKDNIGYVMVLIRII